VSEHCSRRAGLQEGNIPSHIALSLHSVNDVLYGGGGRTHHNRSANERFRGELKELGAKYSESKDKKAFLESIMKEWKNQNPAGRFLQQDTDTKEWFEMEPKVMAAKIHKIFNDAATKHWGQSGFSEFCRTIAQWFTTNHHNLQ
jgi:hypothetical protein